MRAAFYGRIQRPSVNIVLFACGLVDLRRRIDRNRKIAIWIKTGWGNANWSEHRTLGRWQSEVLGSPWSHRVKISLGSSMPEQSLGLGSGCTIRSWGTEVISQNASGPPKLPSGTAMRSGSSEDISGVMHPPAMMNHPEAAQHCRSRSARVCAHDEKPDLSIQRIAIVRLIPPCATRSQIFPATVWQSVFAIGFALSISNP